MQLLGLLFPYFLRTWWWGIFLCKLSDMINDLLIIIWDDIGPDQVLSLSSYAKLTSDDDDDDLYIRGAECLWRKSDLLFATVAGKIYI